MLTSNKTGWENHAQPFLCSWTGQWCPGGSPPSLLSCLSPIPTNVNRPSVLNKTHKNTHSHFPLCQTLKEEIAGYSGGKQIHSRCEQIVPLTNCYCACWCWFWISLVCVDGCVSACHNTLSLEVHVYLQRSLSVRLYEADGVKVIAVK